MVESTEIATYVDLVGLDGSELPTLLCLSRCWLGYSKVGSSMGEGKEKEEKEGERKELVKQ